jgi:enamine deaminase RidA (YjgF/YER057c/UK114 family)
MTAVAGTAPMNPDGSSADGDAGDQMRRCLEIIEAALRDLDVPLNHVVRTRTYLVDPSDEPQVAQVHGEFFGGIRPASTMVVVKSLLRPEWRVEVEADAYSPDA